MVLQRLGFVRLGLVLAFAILTLAVGGDAFAAETSPEKKKAPGAATAQLQTTAITAAQRATVKSALIKQPLSFVKNQGQFHSDHLGQQVQFYEQRKGHAIYFTQDGVYLHLVKFKEASVKEEETRGAAEVAANSLVKLSLIGSAERPEIIPERLQPGKVNYYRGSDSKSWFEGIPTFGAIRYSNVYDGVDVRYYGNDSQLEYDVIVKPGADLEQVRFSYEGIEGLQVTAEGSLEIAISGGRIVQKKPSIYQEIEGKRVEVEGGFRITESASGKFAYGFVVASYDKAHDLIIDPTLSFSTYLGGSSDDMAWGVAADAQGNVYITGQTSSDNFPMRSAAQPSIGSANLPDAFVIKMHPLGALLYSTYLGASGTDIANAIAVDSTGYAWVTGKTNSPDFPVRRPMWPFAGGFDAFVTNLDSNGQIQFSTLLGASGDDSGNAIAVDGTGSAYVVGVTGSSSTPFPTTPGALQPNFGGGLQDAFVMKITPFGLLLFSTYLGGSAADWALGVALDNAGGIYITGSTSSTNFPVTTGAAFQPNFAGGATDAFVTKIYDAGAFQQLSYSTYLGGASSEDWGRAIAVDDQYNAFVTGYTKSTNFPTTAQAFRRTLAGPSEAFVTKLNPTGTELIYSTFLGGTGDDQGNGIAVDGAGSAYVTGQTSSGDFPALAGLYQKFNGGATDAFVTQLDAFGLPAFSTFLGGNSDDYGRAVTEDGLGNIYVVGMTKSGNFPTLNPLQLSAGGWDAFAVKMEFGAPQFLSYSAESGFNSSVGVNPSSGTTSTLFTYKVVYTDARNIQPASVKVCTDGLCNTMSVDASAADGSLRDGKYSNGEQYVFSATLSAVPHSYHFEAFDGATTTTLPSSGNIVGPTVASVVSLPVISPTVTDGTQGSPYSAALSVSGGTAPYTWSATVLPSGLSIDQTTGVISGSSPLEGNYTVAVTVTDANGHSASQTITITINAYSTPPPAQVFDVVDLGTLGGAWSQAVAMNSKGEVTGWSETASGFTHAFLYSNGVMTDLGTLPGSHQSAGRVINDNGQVAGEWVDASENRRAFLYSNGVMTDLGDLAAGGSPFVTATAMNNNGHVVGWATGVEANGSARAFLYDGTMHDLGTLGGSGSGATAINDSDQVVGSAGKPATPTTPFGSSHAFLYSGGEMKDLGALGSGPYDGSQAVAINSSGQVAGHSTLYSDGVWRYRAFLYSSGVRTDLATQEGESGKSTAINSAGATTGWLDTATGSRHAFLYANDVMADLGTLGGTSSEAAAIDGIGRVVGTSTTVNGSRAFVYSNAAMKYISPSSGAWQYLEAAVAINDNGQIAGNGFVNGQRHAFVTLPSMNQKLTVFTEGSGSGTVTSVPAAIDCGASCIALLSKGSEVALKAVPAPGSTFTGWSGACTGTGPCTVILDADTSITATFALQSVSLSVAKSGNGSGTVTSGPAGINCGPTCGANFDYGTLVSLTATPATGSIFTGWTGACKGAGSCTVTVDAAKSVTAEFTLRSFALSVTKTGAGSGTVTSAPAGIDCGAACSGNFDFGTPVTLTATPAPGWGFAGWGGTACQGYSPSCTVTIDSATNVTAAFEPAPAVYAMAELRNGTQVASTFPGQTDASMTLPTGNTVPILLFVHAFNRDIGHPTLGPTTITIQLPNGVSGSIAGYESTVTCTTQGQRTTCQAPAVADTVVGNVNGSLTVAADAAAPGQVVALGDIEITVTTPYNTLPDPLSLKFSVSAQGPPGLPGTPTPLGRDISLQPVDTTGTPQPMTLNFDEVTAAGLTNAVPLSEVPTLPANFQVGGVAYDITTTAEYSPPITVCFSGGFRQNSQILHYEEKNPLCDPAQPATCWFALPNRQLLPAGDPPYSIICADTQTLSPFVVAREINQWPTDNAGGDQVVDASGPSGALVTLVGSGADADLDPLTFSWSGPCGSASTAVATLTCPIGVSTMTLTVSDGRGGTASATATITVLGPMDIKNSILENLTALRATITNRQDGAKLDDAIARLADSLDLSLWIDQTHLDSQLGDQVFDAGKKSAGKLQELLKGRRKTIANGVLQLFINRIAQADRLLALIAISDAQQDNGDPGRIALANDQVAKGDQQAARGLSKEAIDFYRNAWKQVN